MGMGNESVRGMAFAAVAAAAMAAAGGVREESAVVASLRKALADARDGETVVVPSGDHVLYSGLRVNGKTRFTLRGEAGARLVLHFDPSGPVASNANGIAFGGCSGLTVENLRFTTDAWPGAVGRIAAKDAASRSIDIEILPPFRLTGREHLMGLTTFAENRVPDGAFETFGPQPSGLEYEMMAPTRIRTVLPDGVDFARIRNDHLVAIRHELNGNYVLGFGSCHGVVVRDVTIERAMSAGTGISPPCSDLLFERYAIGGDPTCPLLFSENSDGIHVQGVSGSITLRDCRFDGMGDDALNVHCKSGEVASWNPETGELSCVCRNTSRQVTALPAGWAKAGDELIVYDAATLLEKGRAKLLSYEPDGRAVVMQGAPRIAVGDCLGNPRDYPRVTITGCVFGRSRARGILLQTHHIRVSDCVFRGTASPGIMLAADFSYWNEAGPVDDVEISDCLFEECMPFGGHTGILGAIAVRTNHQLTEPAACPSGFHKDIRIVGNVFRDCGRSGVFMASVLGATVASNRFVRCGAAVKPGEPAAYVKDIRFANCAEARAVDNVTDKPAADHLSYESSFAAQCRGRRPLVVNGDNDHYYKAGQMHRFLPLRDRLAREGPRRYLDAIASGGKVTHYFACAIGQRADYDSSVCDPIWLAVDEALSRGEKPDEWPLNAKELHDIGVDPFAEWCSHGRQIGVSVWISQRMNDVHHVNLPWNMRTNRFWYDHPELHRSHGVDKSLLAGDWTDEALNYAFPEVREFEFAIFKELVDCYDADGFELDFMRFWRHLTPGREREEAPILTEFIRRCRAYADEKAAQRGHAILVSTRVPSDYASALAFGFDPETWAREGLVDMIAVANFWASEDFDFGFDEWKRRIGNANPTVAVLPCACDNLSSGAAKICTTSVEALRGWADNVYALGAEGLYFFNAAYMPDSAQREIYGVGFDPQSVAASARRHVATYHDCVPRGMPDGRQLPIDLGKGGEVRVRVGTVPDGRGSVDVVVAGNGMTFAQYGVRLNGVLPLKAMPLAGDFSMYGHAESARVVVFPASAVRAGINVVVFDPSVVKGSVTWVEIDVAKRERRLCRAIGGDEK